MRLIHCHIENFGKLHDCNVEFEKQLNVFYEENGWGKSTLAAFVRAMFYGLDGERKRDISENERKRYMPWQGGIYGGQLTFEIQGKKYLVTRIFRDKESLDEFELRDADTNLVSHDFGNNLGEEIFRIDRNSFMRTVFIGQNDVQTGATDDINAKIGNITDDTNDMNNYKSALERLDGVLNKLNPKRATGSVNKRAGVIAELQRRVKDGSRIAAAVEACEKLCATEYDTVEELKRKGNELSEKQKEVAKLQTIATKKNEWERLQKIASERERQFEEIRKEFPKSVPDIGLIDENIACCEEMKLAAEKAKQKALTEIEESELGRLEQYYALSTVEENEIDKMIGVAGELSELRRQMAMLQLTEEEKERYRYLTDIFLTDVDVPSTMASKWNERNNRKNVLEFKRSTLKSLKMSEKTNDYLGEVKKGKFLTGVGILAGFIGIVLMFFFMSIGVAVLLAGVIIAVIGLAYKNSAKRKMESDSVKQEIEATESEILQYEREIEALDKEISEYLEKHGKTYGEYSVFGDLQILSEQFAEYNTLKKRADNDANSETEQRIVEKEEMLRHFLSGFADYAGNQPFTDRLYSIKEASKQKKRLLDQKREYNAEREKENLCIEKIQDFLKTYGYYPEEDIRKQLGIIRARADECFDKEKYQKEALLSLEEFEQENDMDSLQSLNKAELPSLEELTECARNNSIQLEEAGDRMKLYSRQLDDLNEQYEEWEEIKQNLAEELEIQNREMELHSGAEKAKKILMNAKEAMTARFSTPIMASFSKYYELLTDKTAEAFRLDANTVITVTDGGKQRTVETQSVGWRDLIGVCLRLALVDTMYEDEPPFLVMDDPFINLDDEKVRAAKEFLDTVARKYQVIYFTCCDARR